MERKHMNLIREIIRRLQLRESERRIAKDLLISRPTVHKYKVIIKRAGYLKEGLGLPGDEETQKLLGPGVQPPKVISSVEPYREAVQEFLKQGVEMMVSGKPPSTTCHYLGAAARKL